MFFEINSSSVSFKRTLWLCTSHALRSPLEPWKEPRVQIPTLGGGGWEGWGRQCVKGAGPYR